MYESVTINSFRSILKAELPDLNRVNLFIGPNNSGKSSFLEAIYLLSLPLNVQAILAILGNRSNGFRLSQRSIVSNAGWLFRNHDLATKVQFSGVVNKNKYSVSLQLKDFTKGQGSKLNFSADQNIEVGKLTLSFAEDGKNAPRTQEFSFTNAQGWAIPNAQFPSLQAAALINPHWHSDQMVGVREFSAALMNNFTPACIELLKEFDPRIRDIKIILDDDGVPELFVESADVGLYPITILGDGYKRVFLSSIVMAQVENGCLMMDEFDTGIHHKVLTRYFSWLVQMAAKKNIQLFLSSHSIDVLDILAGLPSDQLRQINVYRIKKDKDQTVVQLVPGESFASSINELGVDLR
ncbi:MAG: AAA family ATPase [Spirochaetales bacterium]